jgi:ribosomal protein L37AE/L43A
MSDGRAVVKRGLCPSCKSTVIHADAHGPTEFFEPTHARMLVVLSFPMIEGQKRVALGPCQEELRPLHHPDEEPTVYFGHLKHRCAKRDEPAAELPACTGCGETAVERVRAAALAVCRSCDRLFKVEGSVLTSAGMRGAEIAWYAQALGVDLGPSRQGEGT